MDISIIIPTYNRKDRLRQSLESFFKQDYPREDFEIIVVDDGSNDGTEGMLKELSKEQINLRYLLQSHKGPAAARNLGIKHTKAEIIGFTDNDCILNCDWVKRMVEVHRLEDAVVAIGGLTKVNAHNIKAVVSQFLSDGTIKTNINDKPEIIFFPTCNVSFKRNYLSSEEFNESFPLPAGEDLELLWRLYKKGYRFIYRPDIEVFHNCHPNFKSFLRQAYMYGCGNYLVQHIHKDHPLLKEIKTQNSFSFFFGLIVNFMKIPRFTYLLGRRLVCSQSYFSLYEKFQIYFYFTLHKIIYLIGNISEHIRMIKINKDVLGKIPGEIQEIPVKPEFIILDITHRCNLRCNICEIRKDKPIEEFTTNEVKDLIFQAIEWGVKEFVLSGGEPFIRKDIFEIFDFVKEKDYHIGVLTNGILLNDKFIRRLLPYLVSNTLSLSISLDALTPEIHDDIRGDEGCFEKTFNGLKILSGLKKNYPNINFNVISIILNKNLEELLPLAHFLKSLNVNSIQFQPLLANNLIMKERSNKVKYWISQGRLPLLDKVVDDLVEFKQQNFYLVRNSENNLRLIKKYFRGILTQDDVRCLYATKIMLIANNGDVTTCFDCYGNVRKKSLRTIHTSKEAEQARKRVRACKNPCLLPCFCD
jgi:MoaA/NifB/PqqE/SkfB family radical SAM enzyme/glycosyltransferase involved in cell wall biosynthesis